MANNLYFCDDWFLQLWFSKTIFRFLYASSYRFIFRYLSRYRWSMLLKECLVNPWKYFQRHNFFNVECCRKRIKHVGIEVNLLQSVCNRLDSYIEIYFTITGMIINCVNYFFSLSYTLFEPYNLWSRRTKPFDR